LTSFPTPCAAFRTIPGPYDAAKHLIAKVGSTDKDEVILKGGHVSLIAGPNAARRLGPKSDSWLGEDQHDRSRLLTSM
jgi:hypothetical protein